MSSSMERQYRTRTLRPIVALLLLASTLAEAAELHFDGKPQVKGGLKVDQVEARFKAQSSALADCFDRFQPAASASEDLGPGQVQLRLDVAPDRSELRILSGEGVDGLCVTKVLNELAAALQPALKEPAHLTWSFRITSALDERLARMFQERRDFEAFCRSFMDAVGPQHEAPAKVPGEAERALITATVQGAGPFTPRGKAWTDALLPHRSPPWFYFSIVQDAGDQNGVPWSCPAFAGWALEARDLQARKAVAQVHSERARVLIELTPRGESLLHGPLGRSLGRWPLDLLQEERWTPLLEALEQAHPRRNVVYGFRGRPHVPLEVRTALRGRLNQAGFLEEPLMFAASPEAVVRLLKAKRSEVVRCLGDAMATGREHGATLSLRADPQGRVQNAVFGETTGAELALDANDCVASVFKDLRFPNVRSKRSILVRYPLFAP